MAKSRARLESIRASNSEFVSNLPNVPVAVFIGGTSGIGQGMVEAFARWRGGQAHIVVIGRNQDAATDILARFPKPTTTSDSEWTHEFIPCDMTLMSNVHTASQAILSKYSKINFLVMTAGYMTTSGRDETAEGIDKKLAVHYYGRWKFLRELEGGLRKAKEAGEEARVISVFSAGGGAPVDLEDLGLKKKYTLRRAEGQATTFNDYMIECFYKRNPNMTFVHAFPGGVDTGLGASSPSVLVRSLWKFLTPLMVSKEECAEYMWHALLSDGAPGARRTGSKSDVIPGVRYSGDEDIAAILWEHTQDVTKTH
ncbi:hypothetical protein DFP72DRAFT_221112 [Ephemerocybe angulata]|uniref:NAD(P)-binding protein n=1 Tax=Ephemerocybe angulata TaxID=980116 RepID=A0A8H6I2D4_9AGAR|nr:hypothetical protein DFP72DRAFT_221112 [Tulosesus angulatus]